MEKPEDEYERASPTVALVFANAQKAVESRNNQVEALNTKLNAIAGFSAALIKFAGDLPGGDIPSRISLVCYSCLLLKLLVLVSLSTAAAIALFGVLAKPVDLIVPSSREQIDICRRFQPSEERYKEVLVRKVYEPNLNALGRLEALIPIRHKAA